MTVLNKELELTDKQEIERLRKVVEEKNVQINGFKKYDRDRKLYYQRFEENYKLMEERFNEFNSALSECEDLDPTTKTYFLKVVQKVYRKRVNDEMEGGALNGVLTRLAKLDGHLSQISILVENMDDNCYKKEIVKETRKARTARNGIVSYIKKKLKVMT